MLTQKLKKSLLTVFLVTVLIISQTACKSNGQNGSDNTGISKTGFFLDTICKVTIYGMSDENGQLSEMSEEELRKHCLTVITDAFKVCSDYEKLFSKTIETSEISKINKSGGMPVTVSDETIEVLKKGIEYGDISGGTFDITVGKVTDLWDFNDEEHTGKIPSSAELKEAVGHVNYNNIEISGNEVRLRDTQTQINLGGVAKGYIADEVGEYLRSRGVVSGIVDLGGNIVVIGAKSEELICTGPAEETMTDFKVGIKDPFSPTGELLGVVSCVDKTVVTSGTYERYFEVDGKRYHHILDSETGYPAETDVVSVTIIADKGKSADCDALSTTCLAKGVEAGMEIIKRLNGFEAIFVDDEGEIFSTSELLKK